MHNNQVPSMLRLTIVRVEPGGYPPGTPTDPAVQNSRSRFLGVIVSLRK
jgi:hypothetical protein